MQCITKWGICYRRLGVVAHTMAALSLVMLTATGIQLESIGGGKAEGTQAAGCCVWKHLADEALAAPELGAAVYTQ
jgi:hypothetical protein